MKKPIGAAAAGVTLRIAASASIGHIPCTFGLSCVTMPKPRGLTRPKKRDQHGRTGEGAMLGAVKLVAVLVVVVALAIVVARLIFPTPDIADRPASTAIPADNSTLLGRLMAEGMAAHPGKSGVLPLQSGHDALASRLSLAAAAQASIDAQYYIWQDDTSGILLLNALQQAAARGVRVRLLLDDNGVPGLDPYMAALNAQENFEIRLFNPSMLRRPKLLGYSFDFFRMNRRMHNKSFIVDGAAAIIGGRNIGNDYFQVGAEAFYVDMDALATGQIVPETATMFDVTGTAPRSSTWPRSFGAKAMPMAFAPASIRSATVPRPRPCWTSSATAPNAMPKTLRISSGPRSSLSPTIRSRDWALPPATS